MKTIRFFGLALMAALGLTLSASPVPKTVENGSTAGDEGVPMRHAQPAAGNTAGAYDITLVPLEGSLKSNLSFDPLMTQGIITFKSTGTLPMGTPTSLTDPRRIDHITAYSLMTSTRNLFKGSFNPTGVWADGNGFTVWTIVGVKSKAGIDNLSLSMLIGDLDSQDQGNHSLRRKVLFSNNSYSPLALGWKADRTPVTSGSADQLVAELVLVIGFPSYDVKTDADVLQVTNYVTGDFAISMGITVGASYNSFTLTLNPPPVTALPTLKVGWVEGKLSLIVIDNSNPGTYKVLWAGGIAGPYEEAGLVKGGNSYPLPVKYEDGDDIPTLFLKYQP